MSSDLPEQAYAAALASTPAVGPATLRRALAQDRPPDAWRKLCATKGATEARRDAGLAAARRARH